MVEVWSVELFHANITTSSLPLANLLRVKDPGSVDDTGMFANTTKGFSRVPSFSRFPNREI